jgi:WD40 repeat protein
MLYRLYSTTQLPDRPISIIAGTSEHWDACLVVIQKETETRDCPVGGFLRDGEKVVTYSQRHELHLWDGITGASVAQLGDQDSTFMCFDISSDGSRLLALTGNGKICFWDGSGSPVGEPTQFSDLPQCDTISVRYLSDEARVMFICNYYHEPASIWLYDAITGIPIAGPTSCSLGSHYQPSPDGNYHLTGSEQSSYLEVLNIMSGQ